MNLIINIAKDIYFRCDYESFQFNTNYNTKVKNPYPFKISHIGTNIYKPRNEVWKYSLCKERSAIIAHNDVLNYVNQWTINE